MSLILIRGGGDLASGVALRLHRSGFQVVITELPNPLAVRRTVSYSEAVYDGEITIEGTRAVRALSSVEALQLVRTGQIAVVVDPKADILLQADFSALVDARLLKQHVEGQPSSTPLVVGLGPGFTCGENCHAVVETQRGHYLGHVYWSGSASTDTGQPEGDARRVLRAPRDGSLSAYARIGDHLEAEQLVARVGNEPVTAPIPGVLRGLVRPGIAIRQGVKIGDIDLRDDPAYCFSISDKALAVGGGVLEAILTRSIKPGLF
jgi:xanthine dehydrogenase accessory factor